MDVGLRVGGLGASTGVGHQGRGEVGDFDLCKGQVQGSSRELLGFRGLGGGGGGKIGSRTLGVKRR